MPVLDPSTGEVAVILRQFGGKGGDLIVLIGGEPRSAEVHFDQKQGPLADLLTLQGKPCIGNDLVRGVGAVCNEVRGLLPPASTDLFTAILHQRPDQAIVLKSSAIPLDVGEDIQRRQPVVHQRRPAAW